MSYQGEVFYVDSGLNIMAVSLPEGSRSPGPSAGGRRQSR